MRSESTNGHAPDLRRIALSGARWTALARLVAESSTLAASVVLARLIPPAEFGRAAVALIVVALAAALGTAGLVAPLVQRRDLSQGHIGSAFFLALASGGVLTLLTALFAWLVAASIFDESTARLILLASPVWSLAGAGVASQALLQRRLAFRRQAAIEGVAVTSSVAVALGAALAGLDGEALVAAALTLIGLTNLLSLVSAPPGSPKPSRRETGEICRFAAPVAASSLAYLGYRNVDYAILAVRGTPAQVGFYWRAFQLGVAYQGKISRVMLRISLPLYSRASGVAELRRMRMRIVRTHATILIPVLATFVGVAPLLIPWLFGETWEPTVAPAQILAVAGMADAVMTGTGPLMVAIGRPGALTWWNLGQLAVYALMVVILAPHGVVVLAVGVGLFGIASTVAMHGFLVRRYLGLSYRQLLLDVRAGIVTGAVVLAGTSSLREAVERVDLVEPVAIVLLCLAATALALATVRTFFKAEWEDVTAIVRRDRGSRGDVQEAAREHNV